MGKKVLLGIMVVGAGFLAGGAGKDEGKVTKEEEFTMPKDPVIVMDTNQGRIRLKLFPEIAPLTCENMIRLAEKGYYNGVIFHRVIKGFMIQGGDPTGTGTGGQSIWGGNFKDEFSEKVKFDRPGLLAMANAGPGTNGSQFFITVVPTPWLNTKHTIFGEVISGYDVVQKIENCQTGQRSRPVKEQKILKMYLLKKSGKKQPEKKKAEEKPQEKKETKQPSGVPEPVSEGKQ